MYLWLFEIIKYLLYLIKIITSYYLIISHHYKNHQVFHLNYIIKY